mmetsp:Transcript_13804/g.31318  ORF Transcript_13804/g.31318 Transcript_13804/m.31318 type:complete len:253 (+) Transcript_13804:134-892(+)
MSDDGQETGLGSKWPCRKLARVGKDLPPEKRQSVLHAALNLVYLGIVLTLISYLGAFARRSSGLTVFPWMVVTQEKTPTRHFCKHYGGMSAVCIEGGCGRKCFSWSGVQCDKTSIPHGCSDCAAQTKKLIVPLILALITYVKLAKNTHDRYTGNDSNCCKFGCVFSTLVGGVNFLSTMTVYWRTCVASLKLGEDDITATWGLGFICMLMAATIKVGVGVVHLCLPVQRKGELVEDSSEASDDEGSTDDSTIE